MDNLIAVSAVLALGFGGGTARYLLEVGMHEGHFDIFRYISHALVGGFVAVMAGFLTDHYALESDLKHFIVGMAACASREFLDQVPSWFVKYIVNRPTKT